MGIRRFAPIASVLFATACTSTGDETPPTLEVTTPERGTMSEASTITVTGQVADDSGWTEVHVNGALATITGDQFTVEVELTPGVEVLETIARDEAGNEARDVRAVLSGQLQPVNSFVSNAVGARIGGEAMGVIGGAVSEIVEGMDLSSMARAYNPVASDPGSCLGYEVFIDSVDIADVNLGLSPVQGAIQLDASVTYLDVHGHADYTFSCFDGTEDFRVTVTVVHASGGLGLAVNGYDVYSSVQGLDIGLSNFQLTTENMPGVIEDYVSDEVEARLPGILEGILTDVIPPKVDQLLADMTSKSYSVAALGQNLSIQARPSAVAIDDMGATVAFDGALVVAGSEGASYVATPAPITQQIMGDGGGLSLAIADDTINQLMAGMWASGAMDLSMPIEPGNPLGLLLGADTRSLELQMMLPPTASTSDDGALHLVVGDMIITTRDEAGEELARFAMTIDTSVAASLPGGQIKLKMGETEAWAHILAQSERIDPQIEESQLEELIESLAGVVGGSLDEALASVTLPSVAGMTIIEPGIDARDGFVIVSAGIAAQ